jgi:hypothetical protein
MKGMLFSNFRTWGIAIMPCLQTNVKHNICHFEEEYLLAIMCKTLASIKEFSFMV